MLLKYNRDTELEVVGLGTFQPNEFVVVGDEEKAKKYLDTGYFDLIKEKKKKVKKSKRKELKNNGTRIKRTHRN
jgi:hypothetical protein